MFDPSQRTSQVDSDIVAAWIAGWAISRNAPPPVAVDGGWRVDVGRPEQRVRYVLADLNSEVVGRIVAQETEPHALFKVCVPDAHLAAHLPNPWRLFPPGWLMSKPLSPRAPAATPDGYGADLKREGQNLIVRFAAADGSTAASGRAALNGTSAVVDQVITDPGHRRRGLGRAIMSLLEQGAAEGGVDLAFLVATEEGRQLYRTLGWAELSPFATAGNAES